MTARAWLRLWRCTAGTIGLACRVQSLGARVGEFNSRLWLCAASHVGMLEYVSGDLVGDARDWRDASPTRIGSHPVLSVRLMSKAGGRRT